MNLRPQAVRMVLAHGLPVVIEVTSDSMTPSLERGTKIKVEPAAGEILPGDIVLILSDSGDATILHRVMHVFSSGGRRIRHPPGRRADVPVRHLPAAGRDRPRRRATRWPRRARYRSLSRSRPTRASGSIAGAAPARCSRSAAGWLLRLKVAENPVSRRLARVYRNVARKLAG